MSSGLESAQPAVESRTAAGARTRKLFLAIVFLYWFSSYIYVPVLSPYVEHLGSSYTMIGMVLGVYGLMQIVLRMPLGIGSDVLNRRRPFILLGLVASGVSCLMFAFGASPGWALTARAVSGIAASAWVVYTVMYAGYFPKEEAGKAMGMMQFVTVLAQLTSMLISGSLVDAWGWPAPFLLGAVIAGIACVLTIRLPEQRQEERGEALSFRDLAPVMREPMLLKVSMLSVLAHCVLFVTMFGYTPNQALKIGADTESLGWLTLSFMAPHALATLYASRFFSRRLGERGALVLGFAGSAVFTLLIPYADGLGALCATQIGNGFMQGIIFPLLLAKSVAEVEPGKRATAMGFYQAAYAVGMSLGPVIAGRISSDYGLSGAFRLAAGAAAAAAVLAWFWLQRQRDRRLETNGRQG